MTKIERIDKWLDSGDTRGLATSKIKSKKGISPADEIALKPEQDRVSRGPRLEFADAVTRIQLLLREAPDYPLPLGKKSKKKRIQKKELFQKKRVS